MSGNQLVNKSKSQLIEMIKDLTEVNSKLNEENSILKEINAFKEFTNTRLEKLEREQNKHLQYTRRDTVEIHGIPKTIPQGQLEDEVIRIFNTAKAEVCGKPLKKKNIHACHRIGRKQETTIVKFTNRKFAVEGLFNGKNLKGNHLYDGNSQVFINNSFCDEFRSLNYEIRQLKKTI